MKTRLRIWGLLEKTLWIQAIQGHFFQLRDHSTAFLARSIQLYLTRISGNLF